MITPGDYFTTQIQELNMITTQLEARLSKGQMMYETEKDPKKKEQVGLHYNRLMGCYNRALIAIEVLSGILNPKSKSMFCASCLGMVKDEDLQEWFKDYEEASTGNKGVPE